MRCLYIKLQLAVSNKLDLVFNKNNFLFRSTSKQFYHPIKSVNNLHQVTTHSYLLSAGTMSAKYLRKNATFVFWLKSL